MARLITLHDPNSLESKVVDQDDYEDPFALLEANRPFVPMQWLPRWQRIAKRWNEEYPVK
jgi:hypothetical protein